jgi:hypothetical protein
MFVFQDIWLPNFFTHTETSLNYLFLAYRDERHLETLPANEQAKFAKACLASDQGLRESGYLLAAVELPDSTVMTVSVQQGKVSLSDAPYARTGKQLVAFFFIQARDLNEAIQVAAKMPQAQGGAIEIRSITEFSEKAESC